MKGFLKTAGIVLAMVAAAPAVAQPLYAGLYKQKYGYAPSCNACHRDGGGSPLGAFGKQFKEAGESLAAFDKIANLDSDGDGVKNAEEAEAKSNPADAQSTPAKKGQWLDVSSLIPKEVQALFPAVREYLPRDAVLTQSDIDRAKAMGVDLNRKDDNTIYIPLAEQRPAGSALIYPAQYKGKVFYLLLATDRQLNITQVKPLNTRLVPEAANAKVYESFKGIALDKLPAGNGSDLDAAISNATRKAGTLVFVRLKGA
ncbi:MAG: thrombospondin type 3 repeat-containing protein [Burkholderiales bacterium]|jgi:hypothetical protein|nr:thrombospondin type 3 repeat-containing protein [Burkholderiales bacterium]